MLGCVSLLFSKGCICVLVEWVLSWREWNVFRGITGVSLLDKGLEDRENVVGVLR